MTIDNKFKFTEVCIKRAWVLGNRLATVNSILDQVHRLSSTRTTISSPGGFDRR